MKILYFAWLKERIGHGEEDCTPPTEVDTPRALIAWLAARGTPYADVFSDLTRIVVAVDMKVADFDDPLGAASEVAFFPPMTGGSAP